MNKYEQLSHTRKQLQSDGLAPDWLSTSGYQLLSERTYLNTAETPKDMYTRIAHRASELTDFSIPQDWGYSDWFTAFYDIMWKGWLSPSTPVLTNMGNDRGHPVSCSGTYSGDSIRSWYTARLEIAQLTQRGYGTSTDLTPIRQRGSAISKGGTANGIMQQATGLVNDMDEITQGSSRRGQIGQYINPLHGDFNEVIDKLLADDFGWNIGWTITSEFDELFDKDPERADDIWKKMMKVKLTKGKGYFLFLDKINANRPQMYRDREFYVKSSNLCAEIALFADEEHSFTCVLSSMNISKFDEWENTKAVEIATVFLDAVISDMLIKAKQEPGFERIIAFTEKSRALGLGQLGQATYFQQKSWVYGDFDTIQFNRRLTTLLDDRTLYTSKLLAAELGEPEWMVGYGERFSHRLAFPPTKSTAEVQGGISEGVNGNFANIYESDTAGGTVYRINPPFLQLMKDRGMYTKAVMQRVAEDNGSVQDEDWLTDHEKAVFRTAFEISQDSVLLLAAHRQELMCATGGGQGQSVNLHFPHDVDEREVSRLHDKAFRDPWIHSLYYVRTLNGASKVQLAVAECESCGG